MDQYGEMDEGALDGEEIEGALEGEGERMEQLIKVGYKIKGKLENIEKFKKIIEKMERNKK